jgi:hypothetical protein
VQGLLFAAIGCAAISALAGCASGGAPSPEPRSSTPTEAAIRAYLARKFVYEGWYSSVGKIDVKHHVALVSTSFRDGAKSRQAAREVCPAVLSSHYVGRVVVRYGPGLAKACP